MTKPKQKKHKEVLREIEVKLKECEKLKQEYLAGWQRAKADFLNYKNEEEKRIKKGLNFVKAGWILTMLTLCDDLERARRSIPEDLEDLDWVQGLLQIENQFQDFFKQQDVEQIKAEGEKFDPSLHEAVEEVETETEEAGAVIEVLEKGYLLNGRVLRPAKVKVTR